MGGALAEAEFARQGAQRDFRTRFGNEFQRLNAFWTAGASYFLCGLAFIGIIDSFLIFMWVQAERLAEPNLKVFTMLNE
jgi:hypothetical protein